MATSEDRLAEEGADCDGAEVSAPRVRSIGGVLGVCGFFFCLMWPGLPLDLPQRKVAAVTALTATLWITVAVPVGASSLLPAVLFPILGVIPAKSIGAHYMQDLVFLFLGAFVIALGLERWGASPHRAVPAQPDRRVAATARARVHGRDRVPVPVDQ